MDRCKHCNALLQQYRKFLQVDYFMICPRSSCYTVYVPIKEDGKTVFIEFKQEQVINLLHNEIRRAIAAPAVETS